MTSLTAAVTAGLTAALPCPNQMLPALGPEWLDPANMISTFVGWVGPWAILGVMLVIFAETGLLVGFFLPGDSLLFTLGMFVAIGETEPSRGVPVSIWIAAPLMFVAAVLGNQSGYMIGHKAGPAIFNKPDSRFFKQEYVERTAAFFEKHGGKAITLAQFVPIVRTFTPVMAGVGRMHYLHFVAFNVIGATFWAFGITWLGYLLGNVQWIQKNIDVMILAIVGVSVLPMVISGLRSWLAARKASTAPAANPSSTDAVEVDAH